MKKIMIILIIGIFVIYMPSCEKKCMPSHIGGFCFVNETQQKIKMQGSTYEWF